MVSLLRRRREMMQAENKRLYLFNNGYENSEITGGWRNYGFNMSGFSPACTIGQTIALSFGVKPTSAAAVSASTTNPIDLRPFTKLVVEYDATIKGGAGNCWVYLPLVLKNSINQQGAFGSDYSSRRLNVANNIDVGSVSVEHGIASFNISDYDDAPYICLNLNTWGKVQDIPAFTIYQMYLEQ